MAVAVSVWMLLRGNDRDTGAAAERKPVPSRRSTIALLLLYTCLAAWANKTGAYAWLLPSLSVFFVAAIISSTGHATIRDTWIPACVPLLSFPIPDPILAEIIWSLQNVTASGAFQITSWLGLEVARDGLEIRADRFAFIVIESCSGFRGIQILQLTGIVVAELHGLRRRDQAILVLLAIPIGIALNVLRAAAVVWTQPTLYDQGFESHTLQGLIVLLVGTGCLYAGSQFLAGRTQRTPETQAGPGNGNGWRWLRTPPRAITLIGAAALAACAVFTPDAEIPSEANRQPIDLPKAASLWTSEPIERDYHFPYSSPVSEIRRTYRAQLPKRRVETALDVYIARERPGAAAVTRIPVRKLLLPGHDWTLKTRSERRLWKYNVTVHKAIVERGGGEELALVYAWVRDDAGRWVATFRSLLGIDRYSESEDARTVIRLAVPITGEDAVGLGRGEKAIEAFLETFAAELPPERS